MSPLPEHVVLLDGRGRATGTIPKAGAHHTETPFHLAFSCHVVDADGRVLVTRRATSKRTWPGVWSNACCGHPQLGETLRDAVARRVKEELGLDVEHLTAALPDFTYRATMTDGTVEHELCPVVVARVGAGSPWPDAAEVDDVEWCTWAELVARATDRPLTLSPWSAVQVVELEALGGSPTAWLDRDGAAPFLDDPIAVGGAVVAHRAVPAGPRLPPALRVVAPRVASTLESFLDRKAVTVAGLDPMLAELTREVRGLVDAGGKRLRPAFTYWGHRATGAAHDDAVWRPAAAVELLHTFALLHDDVMDRSATRRGRPSAHVALADGHRSAGRLGDQGWFGASAAILAGDLAYVWADELFDGTDLPADAVARARAEFTTLREEVIAGQYLDLLLAADGGADEARARQVAVLKSARYTVTRPLLLGAALAPAEAGAAVAPALRAYGDAIGLAFQLRDDILGLFGDPGTTGKGDLDDLREGKRTVLVLRALRVATERDRRELLRHLGDAGVAQVGAARVRAIVERSGALASIEALLAAQHAVAVAAVASLPDPARDALVELADLAVFRTS